MPTFTKSALGAYKETAKSQKKFNKPKVISVKGLIGEYGNAINLSLFWRIFRPKENMFKKIQHNTARESTSDDPKGQSLIGTELWDLSCQRVKIKKMLGASSNSH